jgi:protein-arginine kinase activator protein McsA
MAPLKGAIAGVSRGYIPGVLDARRMNRVVNGEKINSLYGSYIIWSFSLQLGYRNYSQSEHLSQDQCSVIIVKLLGHVSSFCRREKPEMSKLWKRSYRAFLKLGNVTCCNCGGNHEATYFDCLTRVKGNEVSKCRAVQSISYATAVNG